MRMAYESLLLCCNPAEISLMIRRASHLTRESTQKSKLHKAKLNCTVLLSSQAPQCRMSSQQAEDSFTGASDDSRFKSMVDNVEAAVDVKTSLSFGRVIPVLYQ